MEMSVLNSKINSLPLQQQKALESYVDFLVFSTSSKIEQKKRPPLDFSKYETATHLWECDAQDFINGLRQDERF